MANRILIVEDDEDISNLIQEILKRQRYEAWKIIVYLKMQA